MSGFPQDISRMKDVIVVAVTKTLPIDAITSAYAHGFRHFGENYVEEFERKYRKLPDEIKKHAVFHMIGHVQGRKVKNVVSLFDWVDSVDSYTLAVRLSRAAKELGKTVHILLQVNLSGEETKFGYDLLGWRENNEKFTAFCRDIGQMITLPHISIEGLMTMPPLVVGDPQKNQPIFREMRALRAALAGEFPHHPWKHLSMGTSQDYHVAISEGATMVRLGEALFGKRDKK